MNNEEQAWANEIIRHYHAGHYRRALLMMAENEVDNGRVEFMIKDFCHGVDPLAGWKNAGRNHNE